MTDKIGEQLSAWMDGELPGEEVPLLLKRLEEDRPLRLRLQRYQLVRDALKGGLPEVFDSRMAEQVEARIGVEEGAGPGVADAARRTAGRGGWFKPLVGVGIAASVALVAVISVQTRSGDQAVAQGQMLAAQPVVVQLPATPPPVYRAATATAQLRDPEVARRINDYLANHSEYAAAGVREEPPTVRIVDFERSR